MMTRPFRRRLSAGILIIAYCFVIGIHCSSAADEPQTASDKATIAGQRLEVMTARIKSIIISSADPATPKQMRLTPLFRYDDETRGYVDGTVWRLGETGRPLAVITAELHPNYLGSGARVVYDFLSLTHRRFTATSPDIPGCSPRASAVVFKQLPNAPTTSTVAAKRLTQLKEQARRFSGTQEVQELDKSFIHLRLLPREIDRYSPGPEELSDGAIFLFTNGRNPALLLILETDGKNWRYGIGRLSMPSTLEMRLDDMVVWSAPLIPSSPGWSEPYNASNSAAEFP